MWEIYEHNSLVRKLGKIPIEVLKRYEKWKDIVTITGSEEVELYSNEKDGMSINILIENKKED